MRKIKTSESTGAALDWLVAKCEGYTATIKPNNVVYVHPNGEWHHNGNWRPSTNWAQGGPILHREGIFPSVINIELLANGEVKFDEVFSAATPRQILNCEDGITGFTPLIAAMRCYVASKLGDSVDIPDTL